VSINSYSDHSILKTDVSQNVEHASQVWSGSSIWSTLLRAMTPLVRTQKPLFSILY